MKLMRWITRQGWPVTVAERDYLRDVRDRRFARNLRCAVPERMFNGQLCMRINRWGRWESAYVERADLVELYEVFEAGERDPECQGMLFAIEGDAT